MAKNKKNNSAVDGTLNKVIAKTDKENPKKIKKQLKKAKKTLKETPEPNTVKQTKAKDEIKTDSKHAIKNEVKKEVEGDAADTTKQLKKEKKKLKQKLKKGEEKEKTAESAAGPGQTIFVGNVPSNTKRVQLIKLFTPFGKIMSIRFRTTNGKVIFKHKMRKESAALNAYVVFDSPEAATKALELNGTTLKDQILRVQKPENAQDSSDSKRTVFVGNLKYSANDDKLHQIFSSCGEIEYVRTLQSPDKKGCIGTAFVCFKNPDAVGLAMELKGTMLDERPIHVERYSVNKLGANEKRIAEKKNLEKVKPKGGKNSGKKNIGKNIQGQKSQDEKKKKSEFRGVKSEKMKKKLKKVPSQMKRLANKIAPKE